jgi:hypothetical protein
MTRPSRPASLTAVAVAAMLVLLVVAGRWSQGRLDRSAGPPPAPGRPPATTVAPTVVAPTGVLQVGGAGPVDDVAVAGGAVWAAAGATVSGFDQATGRPTATIAAFPDGGPPPLVRLTAGAGALWVAVIGERLLRVDPQTARVAAWLAVVPSAPAAVGAGGVWVPCCDFDGRGRLARIDPATDRVAALVELPGIGDAVGAGPAGVWVHGVGGPVWRVDPAANRVVAAVPVPGMGDRPGSIAVTRDVVWVSDPESATVVRIDPRRNRPAGGRVEADGQDLAAAADGVVWATSGTRLLGLSGGQVLGPYRDLHELSSVRIDAVAVGSEELWFGTPAGLFRVDPGALG